MCKGTKIFSEVASFFEKSDKISAIGAKLQTRDQHCRHRPACGYEPFFALHFLSPSDGQDSRRSTY